MTKRRKKRKRGPDQGRLLPSFSFPYGNERGTEAGRQKRRRKRRGTRTRWRRRRRRTTTYTRIYTASGNGMQVRI